MFKISDDQLLLEIQMACCNPKEIGKKQRQHILMVAHSKVSNHDKATEIIEVLGIERRENRAAVRGVLNKFEIIEKIN